MIVVVGIGGALGSMARYGLAWALPVSDGQIPWATLTANVTGCLLIGILMVLITEVQPVHRLVRPFLGVGVLGGFTTFSTYAVEVRGLYTGDHLALAAGYLVGSVLLALTAVLAGSTVTRAAVGGRIRKG